MGERVCRRVQSVLVITVVFLGMGIASARSVSAQSVPPLDERIGTHLQVIEQLAERALTASKAAETAETVEDVKAHADEVYQTVWGVSSGLADAGATGAEMVHGWKTRWQVDGSEFDSAFVARYGTKAPAVTDVQQLGIMGRGRYVRKQLQAVADDESASEEERQAADRVITALNNVIGWMMIDDGVTKGERQPRVDLTREWDAPSEFWLSTADTGWLHEAGAQAVNILKSNYGYGGNIDAAREHASGMTMLVEKYVNGVDADGNGDIEPVKMEGGLNVALREAEAAGFLNR